MPLEFKKILIICYAFPPYPGVGGRRWAKFAKFLKIEGYDIHVISSENPFQKKSEWIHDVEDLNCTQLPIKYPISLLTSPKGIIGKLQYRIDKFYVKLFSKGNYYDRTIFWEKQLLQSAESLIKVNNIETVIVSGAPFRLFKHVGLLKNSFPNLTLIADIRDPWTSNATSYGLESMSKARQQYEIRVEKSVFDSYNKIITVNETITHFYQNLYRHCPQKFITILNGFDPTENKVEQDCLLNWEDDKINLVFTGTFYDKAVYLFKDLIELLSNEKFDKIKFYFFGNGMQHIKNVIPENLKSKFEFGIYSELAKVNALIQKADFAMLFLTDDINYSFSTKFCEYIKFKKKIIVFSKSGATGEYVTKNDIGYEVNKSNAKEVFEKIEKTGKNSTVFPNSFNIDSFSIKQLTKQLVSVIENN